MCDFDVKFSSTVKDIVAGAKARVEKSGGSFDGDTTSGKFSVPTPKVEGTYKIEGQVMHINIHKKPMMIPCGVVESYIKKQFASADG